MSDSSRGYGGNMQLLTPTSSATLGASSDSSRSSSAISMVADDHPAKLLKSLHSKNGRSPGSPTSASVSQVDGSLAPKKSSFGKSIGSLFKNMFRKDKESIEGSDIDRAKSSPILQAPSFTTSPMKKEGAFSLKSVFSFSSNGKDKEAAQAPQRSHFSVSTVKRDAPSYLLAVSVDLPPKMNRPTWSLKDYSVVEKMYTGYASNVYKAFCKLSGELVCLKSYALNNLCELNRFQIFREVKLHSSLAHEHIIHLYGAFQQGDQVVLVQEYADAGDLFTLLHRYGGRLPERTAVELVLHPFLLVLNYLHQNGIAHRDIKPENVLFDQHMRLKLCDFGLAINLREERAVTRAGTLEYMAPEVLNCPFKNKPEENKENSSLHYGFHVDAWAVGVLTYELLVGLPPFNDKQRSAIEDKIRVEMPRFPSKMSDGAKDFIVTALNKDPIERPSALDMLNHKWIKSLRRTQSLRHMPLKGPAGAEEVQSATQEMSKLAVAQEESPAPSGFRPLHQAKSFTAGTRARPDSVSTLLHHGKSPLSGTSSPKHSNHHHGHH